MIRSRIKQFSNDKATRFKGEKFIFNDSTVIKREKKTKLFDWLSWSTVQRMNVDFRESSMICHIEKNQRPRQLSINDFTMILCELWGFFFVLSGISRFWITRNWCCFIENIIIRMLTKFHSVKKTRPNGVCFSFAFWSSWLK